MPKLPTWSALRAVGNSAPAKASVIVPFVGYLILFNKHVVEAFAFRCIDAPCPKAALFPKLYYLYFGLTFFGFGSFIYQLCCDSRVKRFANEGDYVLSTREIATSSELIKYRSAIEEIVGDSAATSDFLPAQLSDHELAPELKLKILADYYRALDQSRPVYRFLVLVAYLLGFLLMAIPALTNFVEVARSFWNTLS